MARLHRWDRRPTTRASGTPVLYRSEAGGLARWPARYEPGGTGGSARTPRRGACALVVVVIASVLALVPQPAGAADPSVVTWTGAAGDRLWSTPGNWRAEDGTVRLPGPGDEVSVGDGATTEAVVDQPFTVAAVGVGGSTRLTVASALTVTGRLGASDLEVRPGATLVADTYWLHRPTVAAGGRATIRATTGIHAEDLHVAGEVLIDAPPPSWRPRPRSTTGGGCCSPARSARSRTGRSTTSPAWASPVI